MTTTIGNKKSQNFFGIDINPDTALHGFRRSEDGTLTYTKINLNTDEEIKLTNGQGLAFEGLEEFVTGKTASGVVHNTVPIGVDEVGRKAFLGRSYIVKISSPSSNPKIMLDDRVVQEIDLVKGATYEFVTDDPSTQGFPLYISTITTGNNYTYEYTKGVENSRSSYGGMESDIKSLGTGPLKFTVPEDAPDVLYLVSGNHTTLSLKMFTGRTDHANLKNRYYHQVKFDDNRVTYFINERGYLVARYNKNYSY